MAIAAVSSRAFYCGWPRAAPTKPFCLGSVARDRLFCASVPLSLGNPVGGGSVFSANSDCFIGLPLTAEIRSNNCFAELWLCFAQLKITIQDQLY